MESLAVIDLINDSFAEGKAKERAAIVAYLHERAKFYQQRGDLGAAAVLTVEARRIERGEEA